jgi:NTP pyrophosphatase (non-canonical NTP hydrolase)
MEDIQLDQAELLAQLAHEASGLARAARKAKKSGEFTPVSKEILEETGDVLACLALFQMGEEDWVFVKDRTNKRMKRWNELLKA